MRGLSPLARGTRITTSCTLTPWRFIPAGAGNTCAVTLTSHLLPVYPRWRGEHQKSAAERLVTAGLSPLARGTLVSPPHRKRWCRFIPAGAGNTARCDRHERCPPVYPRWRGEHNWPGYGDKIQTGLSPLARGTLRRAASRLPRLRFIPAGAGNTLEDGL